MQQSLKIPDKARRMIDYLQESIHAGKLKQGTKIPPLRDLKDQFGVSLGTAKRGIDYLCRKGLLEANRGSGTYVAKGHQKRKNNALHRIIVLIPWLNNQTGILHTLYSGLLEASIKEKTELVLSHVGFEGLTNAGIQKISDGCSALVMLGEYDRVFKENLNIKMPVVACGMHHNLDGSASLFEMDPYQSADIAVKYFKQHGINHVKCYTGNNQVGNIRLEQFRIQWEKLGKTIDYHEFPSNAELTQYDFAPEGAFLFSSGWIMDAFCKHSLKEYGVKLTEAATVLGLDGRSCVDPDFEPTPTIYADWKQIGHDMYNECMRRINSPGVTPRRYFYPVKLIEPLS